MQSAAVETARALPSCCIVVPFLNEAALIEGFLASVAAQTVPPDRLVLVDDGSTDASPDIAAAFAAEHAWAGVLRRPPRPPSSDRLQGAPELQAFLWAVEQLGQRYDVVAKMDADLQLAPSHVESILRTLAAEPELGMLGTWLHARDPAGNLYVEPHAAHHVRGPTRFYRAECFDEVFPMPALLGWDGADEIRARARGWSTRSMMLEGQQTIHMRPTGLHDGRLRAYARWGECAYRVGMKPVPMLAGAMYRAKDQPRVTGAAWYVLGWTRAAARRVPRFPPDILAASRAENRRRILSWSRSL